MAEKIERGIDLNMGQNLWGMSLEELQRIYDANLQYIQDHQGEYNMGPNLMTELKQYIDFRKSGGFVWMMYCFLNHKGHFFGSLGMEDRVDYHQRSLAP